MQKAGVQLQTIHNSVQFLQHIALDNSLKIENIYDRETESTMKYTMLYIPIKMNSMLGA